MSYINSIDELERFKTDINLSSYAAEQGYELVASGCSSRSVAMRNDYDKVIITRSPDHHWLYFSVHNTQDNGSIIDFVQHRKHFTLGEVRKELRDFLGVRQDLVSLSHYQKDVEPSVIDLDLVRSEFSLSKPLYAPFYLVSRGISRLTLSSERFSQKIYQDKRYNCIFPHVNSGGLCGFELKNKNFTGFSKGGEKSAWFSNYFDSDTAILFSESSIDALSHYEVNKPTCCRYFSLAGQLNPYQVDILIPRALNRMPRGSKVYSCFDNDSAGDMFTELLFRLVSESKNTLFFEDVRPDRIYKDYNIYLTEILKNFTCEN